MKFAFILSHIQYYHHFDDAIRQLCANGHSVSVVTRWFDKPNTTDRALEKALADLPGISFEQPQGRRDVWKYLVRPARELINYTLYFRPEHPSPTMARLWRQYFSPIIWAVIRKPGVARFLAQQSIQNGLRKVEDLTPPGELVVRWLRNTRPDAVIASPLVTGRSMELEYMKAAKAMNIPTVFALASWDNLTTKGTIHVQPDLAFVWNSALLEEAVNLHGVPRQNVVITGAPTFDYWFQMQLSGSREAFCRQAGIDPKKEYVVYLCTARRMIDGEIELILDLAAELQKNPVTKDVILLVRPHPYNELDLAQLASPQIRVFPGQGDLPDVESAKQTYFNTLHYAKATVAINTSAMIESAIVDVPCVAVIEEKYRSWQTDMGHFHHLLDGNFLEVRYSNKSAIEAVAGILNGQDSRRDQRRAFVREFIRPLGLGRPASGILAHAIKMAAERKTAAEITEAIWSGDK
jgi:hypothetical protein